MPEIERVAYTMTTAVMEAALDSSVPKFMPPPWSKKVWGAFFTLLGCSAVCAFTSFLVLENDLGDELLILTLGCLVACAILPLLMLGSCFLAWGVVVFVHGCRQVVRLRMRRAYREIMDTEIRWAFSEAGFETESIQVYRTVAWTDLKQIQRSPGFWVFSVMNGPALMFPDANLTPKARDLIERKVKEHRIDVKYDRVEPAKSQ